MGCCTRANPSSAAEVNGWFDLAAVVRIGGVV
jgi:hypothetical protein